MVMMILGPQGALSRDEVESLIGHNGAPEPSPFEAVKVHVDDLMAEARGWLDGAAVETQAQADEVSKLLDMLRKAKAATDNARKEEAKPHDDGKAEVQARYKPLLESADLAVDLCKKALAPFLTTQESLRLAAAAVARRIAEDAQRAAAEAARAASAGDLAQQEAAKQAERQAKTLTADARRTENAKTHATGGGRATTLRTTYTPILTDGYEAAKWAWTYHRPEMEEFITSLAKQRVAGGLRTIAGFDVIEQRSVV